MDVFSFYTSTIDELEDSGLTRDADCKWGNLALKNINIKATDDLTLLAKCSAFDYFVSLCERFFGYLTNSPNTKDKKMRGLGISKAQLSISLLTNVGLLKSFLAYLTFRQNGRLTTGVEKIVKQIIAMLQQNSFFVQHPVFGKRYYEFNTKTKSLGIVVCTQVS